MLPIPVYAHATGFRTYSAGGYDSDYTGAVATAGTYGLFTAPESNLAPAGAWQAFTAGGYPSGVPGGGMANNNPATGGDLREDATFEIHFECSTNGSFTLYALTNPAYGSGSYTLDGGASVPAPSNQTSGLQPIVTLTGLSGGRHVLKFFGSSGYNFPQYYVVG